MIVSLDPWDENGPMKIYEKIKKGLILFPKNINKNLNNFIQYLLIGVPNKRMGTFLNDNKKNKFQIKYNRGKGSSSVQKKIGKEKYEPISNIQGVINDLMEVTKSPPPPLDNNLKLQNNNQLNNVKINNETNKENQLIILIQAIFLKIQMNMKLLI